MLAAERMRAEVERALAVLPPLGAPPVSPSGLAGGMPVSPLGLSGSVPSELPDGRSGGALLPPP